MLILQAKNLTKSYGDRTILHLDELSVYSGERIGIVGANGAGKTTLLKLLLGQLEPDGGTVELRCPYTYVGQLDGDPADMDKPDSGHPSEAAAQELSVFQVADRVSSPVPSGGETTRMKLAAAFSRPAPLLACDEPTTNLDLSGVEYLTQRLTGFEGAILMISHDRALLDAVCDKLLEVAEGEVNTYYGGYTEYKAVAEANAARKRFEYDQYLAEKTRLEQSIAAANQRAAGVRKAPKRMGNSEARLHRREATEIASKLSGAAKGMESRLSQLEVKDKPTAHIPIRIDLSLTDPPRNRSVITAGGLSLAFGDRVLFDNASFEAANFCKTALVGANGTGKTTLLRLITGGNPAIRVAPQAKLGYFAQNLETLDPRRSILDNVLQDAVQPAETVRTILARLSFRRESVYKPVEVLSGGERIKVAIAKLVCSENNVLVLDEPTNYLDLESIEALQEVLRAYEGAVLFVSHDRAFIDAVADRLLILENGRFTAFQGNYSDWLASKDTSRLRRQHQDEAMLLDMRIAQLTASIGSNPPNREELAAEWESLVEKRRSMHS